MHHVALSTIPSKLTSCLRAASITFCSSGITLYSAFHLDPNNMHVYHMVIGVSTFAQLDHDAFVLLKYHCTLSAQIYYIVFDTLKAVFVTRRAL